VQATIKTLVTRVKKPILSALINFIYLDDFKNPIYVIYKFFARK
jgi:hypothetical protein